MAKRSGNNFGDFQKVKPFNPGIIKPITTEFSKGSVPDSIYAANRESAWSRWRKGYELANAYTYNNEYTFSFNYEAPNTASPGNPNTVISGAFVGFPTSNKELGMHWAIWRYAGSVRTDKLTDPVSTQKLFVESVTEDLIYWYIKLAGTWSSANPLPAPFYIPVSGEINGLKPANTEIFEDRILVEDGIIITSNTINPQTQTRYGYVQAVVVAINQDTGVLTFKKAGSVYVSPDKQFISPSPVGFTPGRFLITGSRYACTCQDFTRRDYSFVMGQSNSNQKQFPRTRASVIKPGRFEVTQVDGVVDNSAMTEPGVNRDLDIYAPKGFELDYTVTNASNTDLKATRDNPGVYREFGSIYKRSTSNISTPGSTAEGMPGYDDYSSFLSVTDGNSIPQDVILSISDNWTPLLDELRYCKHIYALKFRDKLFPPEPSDFPVGITGMVEWEQKLVKQTEIKIQKDREYLKTVRSLSVMDVPPYNAQSPILFPVIQKLFNIATNKILIENFTMLN
jgi:hypothetical protein